MVVQASHHLLTLSRVKPIGLAWATGGLLLWRVHPDPVSAEDKGT
jgi:hypothetical protein